MEADLLGNQRSDVPNPKLTQFVGGTVEMMGCLRIHPSD